jgi:hypothetical protein
LIFESGFCDLGKIGIRQKRQFGLTVVVEVSANGPLEL